MKPINTQRTFLTILSVVAGAISLLTFGSCRQEKKTISLSAQYGLAYAPVTVARLKGWFEEEVPDIEFQWKTTGNATGVREAILAGKMDGGFMGIPPYLIGRDRGMKWTATAAIAEAELGLVTIRPGIKTLLDIPSDMRIALPQPGSIQHILLAMAAERELGDAGIFDNRLVTLSHPDGLTALMSGTEIEAHFTSPPYLQKELELPGAKLVLDGNEAFGGPFTFIVAVFSDDFIDARPTELEGILRAIRRGAEWINNHPDEAAEFLASHYRLDTAELEKMLGSGILSYGGRIRGMENFKRFMTDRGYLKAALQDDKLISP